VLQFLSAESELGNFSGSMGHNAAIVCAESELSNFSGSMEPSAAIVSDESELGQKDGIANTGFSNDVEGKNSIFLIINCFEVK
jgi:hypothetical protein